MRMIDYPEYKVWVGMKARCRGTCKDNRHIYFERGIKVCDRWLESFWNFYEDMGPKPSPKHVIDRIDNEGDYKPTNCRWVTFKENSRNTRYNKIITINNVSKTLSEWLESSSIGEKGYYHRINNLGMTPEEALTLPSRNEKRKPISINGISKTRRDWCKYFGIGRSTYNQRRASGMSEIDALTTPNKFKSKLIGSENYSGKEQI